MYLPLRSITQVAKTLSALPKLQYVDLGFDGIEGPLDSACGLAKTKKLASLNLMNNALTGSIPACFGQLPALAELHVDYNQLTGAIPAFDVPNSPMVYFSAAYQVWEHDLQRSGCLLVNNNTGDQSAMECRVTWALQQPCQS